MAQARENIGSIQQDENDDPASVLVKKQVDSEGAQEGDYSSPNIIVMEPKPLGPLDDLEAEQQQYKQISSGKQLQDSAVGSINGISQDKLDDDGVRDDGFRDDGVDDDLDDMRPLLMNDIDFKQHDHISHGHEVTEKNCVVHRDEAPTVECVFIVRFHNNKGNVLEWSKESDGVFMEGLAEKAIVSGFHNIDEDYVYFKHNSFFGVAGFHRHMTKNSDERNVRMRSVGVLGPNYKSLNIHVPYLVEQAKRLNESSDENAFLEVSGELEKLFSQWNKPQIAKELSSNQYSFPYSKNDMVLQFIHLFGVNIMVLWKALLLQKRILFYTPVPLGNVCHQVLSLISISFSSFSNCRRCNDKETSPLFYVTLNDVDTLKSMTSFVSITTNQIFREKSDLYDVMFDGDTVRFGINERFTKGIQLTKGDMLKYESFSSTMTDSHHDHTLLKFFQTRNDHLVSGLEHAKGKRVFVSDLSDEFGLHESDKNFFIEYVETHNHEIDFHDDQTFLCVPMTICGGQPGTKITSVGKQSSMWKLFVDKT